MGTTSPRIYPLVLISTRVRSETAKRVNEAAKRADQPVSAWLRMAIMEKLERDGG
jgi:predicted transcriptional regulator